MSYSVQGPLGAEAITCFGCPTFDGTSLGEIDRWTNILGHLWNRDDVYVYRITAYDVTVQDPSDALRFVEAAGRLFARDYDLDTVAVGIDPGSGGETLVDIIMMHALPGPIMRKLSLIDGYPGWLMKDDVLTKRWPGLSVANVVFGRLNDAAPVKHWRSQPILWNHLLTNSGSGGRTNTFLRPDHYSVVRGTSEDGEKAIPWVEDPPPPEPPEPPDPPAPPSPDDAAKNGAFVACILALGWLAAVYIKDKVRP